MPFIYKNGDMFATSADAIINTVNCVGVMGKGVALQFKNRWPENFKAYKAACLKKQLHPGKMFVFENGDMLGSLESDYKYLINFPTKNHWRSKSKIEYIDEGLEDLVSVIRHYDIKSICIPPLGCGNGGLDWNLVRPKIEHALSEESLSRNIFIFGPRIKEDIPEYENIPINMTFQRALFLRVLGDFESYFGGGYTKISLQKIVYFLQVLGVNFEVKFTKNIYGPYSSTLARALIAMSDAKALIDSDIEAETVRTSASGYSVASDYLENDQLDLANSISEKLSQLISGFESSFGLELLASVHYLAINHEMRDLSELTVQLHDWSERKQNLFSKDVVSNALERLKEDRILT